MNRSQIINICNEYSISPNKNLGQNFLVSSHIEEKIIAAVSPDKSDNILEIGPGLGSITEKLSEESEKMTLVEIDSGFFKYLSEKFHHNKNITIYNKDFLKTNINSNFTKIVSNLPYYCASEIIFKIAKEYNTENIYILIQKEFAERLSATEKEKNYGALSVNAQFYFDIRRLFDVKKSSFYPVPKILSSFVHLKRKKLKYDPIFIAKFHIIVKSAFWGRRKQILKALTDSPHLDLTRDEIAEKLNSAEIDFKIRGESLSLDKFLNLTKFF